MYSQNFLTSKMIIRIVIIKHLLMEFQKGNEFQHGGILGIIRFDKKIRLNYIEL